MHRNLTFRNRYWKIIWKRASQSRRFPVCFQSVKRTIYRKMERCGPRGLNFSNISDDELDRNVTEAAKDFPFYGEQMLKFLHRDRGIKGVSRKLISDLRPQTPETSGPSIFFFFNCLHCKLVSVLIT